jgi:hypothetical protein
MAWTTYGQNEIVISLLREQNRLLREILAAVKPISPEEEQQPL